jgi:hypothetical protein
MNGAAAVTLPGGYWAGGECHRDAGLRPLTGDDEAYLIEIGDTFLPAHRTTALLARGLTRLGPLQPVPPAAVQSLTVGDREALLLHLRRLTMGDRMPCVLTCLAPACGAKMDLDLKVGDLLLAPYTDSREWYERSIEEEGQAYQVRFRLPSGADQEAIAARARVDPEGAAELLLRRCVARVSVDGERDMGEGWPPIVREQLPVWMAELDPQAELMLNLACPACDHAFSALFDTATYWFQELAGRSQHLYREVHFLAFHYHWSEAEIMGMTARKRRRYLDLLDEELCAEGRP